MINGLKVGNKVVTNGGIVGVVKEIDQKENQVEVEIASGVNIRILRSYVADLIKEEKKSEKEKFKNRK